MANFRHGTTLVCTLLWVFVTACSASRATSPPPSLPICPATRPSSSTQTPGTTDGATELSGRLQPEEIQSVVRSDFPKFRDCYGDSQLRGTVSVRFEIGLSGTVACANSSGTSTFPDDAIVACVVNVFAGMHFPEPTGGTVTVVYPIMLAPG